MLQALVAALTVIFEYTKQSGGSTVCTRFVKGTEYTYNFKTVRSVNGGILSVSNGTPSQNRAEQIS